MRKEKKSINIFAIALGVSAVLALILFLFLNVAGNNFGSVMGFNSVFGVKTTLSSGASVRFNTVNGVGISMFILFLASAVLSGFLGNYKRAFYIVTAVVDVALIIMIFTYHSSWLHLNLSNGYLNVVDIGAGLIVSGIIMILHAIASLVAFKFAENLK